MKRPIIKLYLPGLIFIFAFVAVLSFLSFKEQTQISAVSTENFSAGNIISDYVMSKYYSMTEAEIQAFLKSKNSCNNTNYSLYQYVTTRYPNTTWNWRDGHFVCMADDTFDGETAAHIIWQAAQDYRINPQVLIVLLEKEQGLITDDYPNSFQYSSATGYGCPDSSVCDSQYYGLKNQIRNAAKLFRTVLDGGWTNYPVGNNYIKYNPDSACGGSVVYIENLATSALYRYTPYQPNAESLAAGYGSAYCGAYGNRNFYLYFNNWFGSSTQTREPLPSQSATIESGTYTIISKSNQGYSIDIGGGAIKPGANIQTWSTNLSNAQKWTFKYNSTTGLYTIINPTSGYAIDVGGGSIRPGANIQLWDSNDSCAQHWKAFQDSDGDIVFQAACSEGTVLSVDKQAASGTNVSILDYQALDTQKWQIQPTSLESDQLKKVDIPAGVYTISTKSTEKALDVGGGSLISSAPIQLWNPNKTEAQKWQITYNPDTDLYTIFNAITGKALDVGGGSIKSGAPIQLWDSNDSCAQHWKAFQDSDGYIVFQAACSTNLVLSTSSSSNASRIRLSEYKNEELQRWKITKP